MSENEHTYNSPLDIFTGTFAKVLLALGIIPSREPPEGLKRKVMERIEEEEKSQ